MSAGETRVKREREPKRESLGGDSEFDQRNAARNVWLVKVPDFVKAAWASMPGDSVLGQLVVQHTPGKEPTLRMELSHEDACAELPKRFALTRETPPDPMLAFCETLVRDDDDDDDDDDGGGGEARAAAAARKRARAAGADDAEYAAEGRVEKRVDATPIVDGDYLRLMGARRSAEAAARERPRVRLNTDKQIIGVGLTRARRAELQSASLISERARGNRDRNRVQMPRGQLLNRLLALFEARPELTLQELDHECQQPMNHLKDVLAEVAEFVRSRKVWQLKPEYRVADNHADERAFAQH